jgi:hypothetical protein
MASFNDAPHGQDSNFRIKRNIWSWAPAGARHQDRLTDCQLQHNFDFDFDFDFGVQQFAIDSGVSECCLLTGETAW